MRTNVLILIFLSPFIPFAQSAKFKHKVDHLVVNLPDATLKFDLPAKDVKAMPDEETTYYWYKSNSVMHTKGGYEGKLLHGSYSAFYLSNNLKEKGLFKKGLKYGEWIAWFENGEMKEIINYVNGLRHGSYKSFNDKGQLLLRATYRYDKLHGVSTTYQEGKPAGTVKYKKGVEIVPAQKVVDEGGDNVSPKKKFSIRNLFRDKTKKEQAPLSPAEEKKPLKDTPTKKS